MSLPINLDGGTGKIDYSRHHPDRDRSIAAPQAERPGNTSETVRQDETKVLNEIKQEFDNLVATQQGEKAFEVAAALFAAVIKFITALEVQATVAEVRAAAAESPANR